MRGEPVRGELVVGDATLGVEIPLYRPGTLTQRTIQPNEWLHVSAVHVLGGDAGSTNLVEVYISTSASAPGQGRIIAGHGSVAQNANGLHAAFDPECQCSPRGGKPFLRLSLAVIVPVKVNLSGFIRRA